jgi:hypothetical protein
MLCLENRCLFWEPYETQTHVQSRVGVTYKTGTGNTDYRSYNAIADLHTLQFTVTHTHCGSHSSLVVSWQRIYNLLTIT